MSHIKRIILQVKFGHVTHVLVTHVLVFSWMRRMDWNCHSYGTHKWALLHMHSNKVRSAHLARMRKTSIITSVIDRFKSLIVCHTHKSKTWSVKNHQTGRVSSYWEYTNISRHIPTQVTTYLLALHLPTRTHTHAGTHTHTHAPTRAAARSWRAAWLWTSRRLSWTIFISASMSLIPPWKSVIRSTSPRHWWLGCVDSSRQVARGVCWVASRLLRVHPFWGSADACVFDEGGGADILSRATSHPCCLFECVMGQGKWEGKRLWSCRWGENKFVQACR